MQRIYSKYLIYRFHINLLTMVVMKIIIFNIRLPIKFLIIVISVSVSFSFIIDYFCQFVINTIHFIRRLLCFLLWSYLFIPILYNLPN